VPIEDGVDGATGSDGGQLALVADEHEFGVGSLDPDGEPQQVSISGHGGLVEHDHGLLVENLLAVVEPPEERPQDSGLDPSFSPKCAGGLSARGRAEDAVADRLKGVAGGVESRGLSCASDTDHHVDAVP
jgi:hypothetical protein